MEFSAKNFGFGNHKVGVFFLNKGVHIIVLIMVLILTHPHQRRFYLLTNQTFALIRIYSTESTSRASEMLVAKY